MTTVNGLARLAANSGQIEVALGAHGRPVTERQVVSGWDVSGGTLKRQVRFGPFAAQVEATELLVWVAGDGPSRMALSGSLGLPPGVPFVYDLSLSLVET